MNDDAGLDIGDICCLTVAANKAANVLSRESSARFIVTPIKCRAYHIIVIVEVSAVRCPLSAIHCLPPTGSRNNRGEPGGAEEACPLDRVGDIERPPR